MSFIDEKELKQQLRSGGLQNVYMLYGDEEYLIRHYSDQIVSAVSGGRSAGFGYIRFEGDAFSSDELSDAAELVAFGIDKKCIEVLDMPLPDMSSGEYSKLLELLRDPPDTCLLLFRFSHVNPEKNAKGENGQSRFKEFSELVSVHGAVVKLDRREDGDLKNMLMTAATKRGCRMSSYTAMHLLETCGNDLQNLRNEMDKLIGVCSGREITQEDIDGICCRTLESDTFEMVRAIERRNADRAFAVLSDLFAQKTAPVMILGALASSYINMYRARCASEAPGGIEAFSRKTGLKAYSLNRALKSAGRCEILNLRLCVDVLAAADLKIKNTSSDEKSRTVIEETIVKLLSAQSKR